MRRLFSPLMICSLLSLPLTGCIQFQNRPLSAAESGSRIELRTLSSEGLREFFESATGRETRWPSQSRNVDQLTPAAMSYHPDLALARPQADSADAATITAVQRPNPSITILPTWVNNTTAGINPWIVVSAINIPVEVAGKRQSRMDKVEHLAEAARLRILDAAWLARGRRRLAMLEAYAALESERLLQRQLTIRQTMTERLEQHRSVRETARSEVVRSHLALNLQQLNVSAARKKVAENRVMVAAATGVPVESLSGIELDLTNLSKPSVLPAIPVHNLKEIALQERPDVVAALANYATAQSALQLKIANQYPDIQTNPGYAWNLGEHRWTLGAILPVPVFHHNQGLITEAEAACLLGIHRSQLHVKLKELGLVPEEEAPLPEEREHS